MTKTANTVTNIHLMGAERLNHFECGLAIDVVEILLRDSVAGGDHEMAALCRIALFAPCAQGNLAAQKIERLLFGEEVAA